LDPQQLSFLLDEHWQLFCNEPEHEQPCFAVFPEHLHVSLIFVSQQLCLTEHSQISLKLPEHEHPLLDPQPLSFLLDEHWQLFSNEPEHEQPCFAMFPIHKHDVTQEHDSVTDPVQEQPVTDELPEQEHATKAQVQESWT
jgi:hypothetical protein